MSTQEVETNQYRVFVDSNAHYMDESERYLEGSYEDCGVAVAKCKQIVDGFLSLEHEEGMEAATLLRLYTSFGEDPWISSADKECKFSAWTYAEQRCKEICRS
jgi:hypothetical protein